MPEYKVGDIIAYKFYGANESIVTGQARIVDINAHDYPWDKRSELLTVESKDSSMHYIWEKGNMINLQNSEIIGVVDNKEKIAPDLTRFLSE